MDESASATGVCSTNGSLRAAFPASRTRKVWMPKNQRYAPHATTATPNQVRTSVRRDIEPPSPDEVTSQSRFNHTIKLVRRILHDALASLCTHRLSEWTRCKVQLFLDSDQSAIE